MNTVNGIYIGFQKFNQKAKCLGFKVSLIDVGTNRSKPLNLNI